jgi:hypothetical protein
MIEQEIERKIQDFRSTGIPQYIPRAGRVVMVDHMVSTVIGGRRTGKSFRILQAADELIRGRRIIKSPNQICYLDFDNPILSSMQAKDLKLIQTTFLKMNPDMDIGTGAVFLLDEIHKILGWEDYVIDLSRNAAWKVIVTGSSSKLLRQDVATELRGKAVSSEVYPLSFREYLTFKQFRHPPASTKGMAEAQRLFDAYLRSGGYPALVNLDDYAATAVLREYFDTMILKDVIQRYDISKPRQCIHLYRYLLSNIGKPFTLQSLHRFLKQAGFATSRDTLRDLVGWAADSWLIFSVPLYSDSVKEQDRNYKKLYAIDWALAAANSSVWDGSLSRSLENMVFLHLHRQSHRVHYYLTKSKRQEVDFIAVDGNGHPAAALQVCLDVAHDRTMNREMEPLISAAKYFGIKNNYIITRSFENSIKVDGVNVKILPAWKWMMEE